MEALRIHVLHVIDDLKHTSGLGFHSISDEAFDERSLGASIPSDRWHFHRQLLARYGFFMAPGEFTCMLNDITKGRTRPVMATVDVIAHPAEA